MQKQLLKVDDKVYIELINIDNSIKNFMIRKIKNEKNIVNEINILCQDIEYLALITSLTLDDIIENKKIKNIDCFNYQIALNKNIKLPEIDWSSYGKHKMFFIYYI